MVEQNAPIVFLMGPTGVGKSDIALMLASRFPFEIVSVDSGMVYRDFDIGTAKPSSGQLDAYPHRLIDICDHHEYYSAGRFRKDASDAIRSIHSLNKIPLLVGGTGLYFKALLEGLDVLPVADVKVRERIKAEAAQCGWASLHHNLSRIDPQAAQKIHPNDSQRIERAMEIFHITGSSLSSHLKKKQTSSCSLYNASNIFRFLLFSREQAIYHHMLETRMHTMFEQGWVAETEAIKQKLGTIPSGPSGRLVGYRQIFEYLDGKLERALLKKKVLQTTKQLAKRQMTWFKRDTYTKILGMEHGSAKVLDSMVRVFDRNVLFK